MKKNLQNFIREVILETKIAASPEYLKKEAVMQLVQRELAFQVRSGKIKTKMQMDKWLDFYLIYPPPNVDIQTLNLAINTLKSIPDPQVFSLKGSVASEKLK